MSKDTGLTGSSPWLRRPSSELLTSVRSIFELLCFTDSRLRRRALLSAPCRALSEAMRKSLRFARTCASSSGESCIYFPGTSRDTM